MVPADISATAVQCTCMLHMWQLQQYLQDQAAPPPEWCSAVVQFAQHLHGVVGAGGLQAKALAVRTLADLYLIFKSPQFPVSI